MKLINKTCYNCGCKEFTHTKDKLAQAHDVECFKCNNCDMSMLVKRSDKDCLDDK